jgi:hypothetical protein
VSVAAGTATRWGLISRGHGMAASGRDWKRSQDSHCRGTGYHGRSGAGRCATGQRGAGHPGAPRGHEWPAVLTVSSNARSSHSPGHTVCWGLWWSGWPAFGSGRRATPWMEAPTRCGRTAAAGLVFPGLAWRDRLVLRERVKGVMGWIGLWARATAPWSWHRGPASLYLSQVAGEFPRLRPGSLAWARVLQVYGKVRARKRGWGTRPQNWPSMSWRPMSRRT